jgi:hypothetical protein
MRSRVLLVAVFSAVAQPLPAQSSDPLPPIVRERLRGADRLRIHLRDGEEIVTRGLGAVGGALLLPDGRIFALSDISRIDALDRRTGDFAVRGFYVGAMLGAALLQASSPAEEGFRAAALTLTAAAGGGALGIIGGGLIGQRRFTSHTVYQADAARPVARAGDLPVEYRYGPAPGIIRTRLAITPILGFATYGPRTGIRGPNGWHAVRYGLASGQEAGVQAQWAATPRTVIRGTAAAARASHRVDLPEGTYIAPEAIWLQRAELGLEFRLRHDVPGYFVLAADLFRNAEGYAFPARGAGDDGEPIPTLDGGIIPRLGAGIGFDVDFPGDRRVRTEWIYRIGRYHEPAVEAWGLEPTTIIRDSGMTFGLHIPLRRPPQSR